MFPPKPSQNPQEWLNGLWSSLQRGGFHFGQEAHLELGSDGSIQMKSKMAEPLPERVRGTVTAYMKQYARACGWNLKVSFRKGYCELEASSRAESKASKKA